MARIVFACMLAAALAHEPVAAMEHRHDARPQAAGPALADGGRRFSQPVAVSSEPEEIVADAVNRPKIAIAQDGTLPLSWTESLPRKYAGDIRFARSTDGCD